MDILLLLLALDLIVLAAGQIGQYFTQARLPLISCFLFTGILTGLFVPDFIYVEVLRKLNFINQISMTFIALAVGSELYLKELIIN